jgi:hypothetical protein
MQSRKPGVTGMLALFSLAMVILACGGGTGVQSNTPVPPTATPVTPTATPDPSAQVPLNPNASASQSGVTLDVVGLDAADSPNAPLPSLGIACTPALVFASPSPTSLSATDVSQTRTYLQQVPENDDGYPLPSASLPPPAILRWVAQGMECLARLEVTNNTGQDIILVSAGVRVLGGPVSNTYHYSLVDICNVRNDPLCGNPSIAPDRVYTAQTTLGPAGVGAVFSGRITVSPDADPGYPPTFLLPAGATRAVDLSILPPANNPASIYRVVPELTIQDTTTHTLVFSSLPATLVYSSNTQFSCFGLLRNQIVPDSQIQYPRGAHAACV